MKRSKKRKEENHIQRRGGDAAMVCNLSVAGGYEGERKQSRERKEGETFSCYEWKAI